MTIVKLQSIPSGRSRVFIDDDGRITLINHLTRIVEINPEGWLIVYGLYQATIRKHIAAFAKEYTSLDFKTLKKCFENGLSINIHTGKVIETKKLTW